MSPARYDSMLRPSTWLKRPASPLLILLAVLLPIAACSQSSTSQRASGPPASVTARLTGDFDCLDPYGNGCDSNIPGIAIFQAMYDFLLVTGPGGKLTPSLARSWTVATSSVTFKLQSGVTCSDGTAVTPTVVANSLNSYFARLKAEGFNLIGTWGPGPYNAEGDDGAGTVTFTMGTANPLAVYGFLRIPIVCPAGIGAPTATQALPIFDSASQGSGPYTMASAVHGQGLDLKLRKDWKWGPNGITAASLPGEIKYQIIANDTTSANLLTTGGLDIAPISGPDIARLLANPALTAFKAASYTSDVIAFNETPGHPTADFKVRQAIATAFNANEYGTAAFGAGRYLLATNFLSPQSDCYQNYSSSLPRTSIPNAQKILEDDGYVKDGSGIYAKGGQELAITVTTTNTGLGQAGEYLASMLTQLGVKVNSNDLDFTDYANDGYQGKFDMFTETVPGSSPAPNQAVAVQIGPNNFAHAVDPAAYTAAQQAQTELGCAGWQTFWGTMVRNLDFLPTVYPYQYWFTRNKLQIQPAAAATMYPQFIHAG